MAEDNSTPNAAEAEAAKPKPTGTKKGAKKRSKQRVSAKKRRPTGARGAGKLGTMLFPKHSILKALRIPQAVLENNAGRDCTDREAATFAGLGWTGSVRVEISSAIKYGLFSRPNPGRVQPTDLIRRIVRPQKPNDKVDAENETRELRIKLSVAEQTNLNLRESFAQFEETVRFAIERSNVSDARTVDLALEKAARKQERPARRTLPNITETKEDPNSMFVLMPFREEFGGVYKVIHKAGNKLGIRVFRADEMISPGRITDQILQAINKSGIILADLTYKNPNVLYEVGIAHTLNKKTILITQDAQDIPFDLAYLRFIVYENTVSGADKLEQDLVLQLRYLLEDHATEDKKSHS